MQSFAEAIRGRLGQERRSLEQAMADGDLFDQDVHEAALEDLYRLALQNGVTVHDPAPEGTVLTRR
ncbi:MAG: hypothetical protein JWL58_6551 [Streptosporangiaceae bacterium]|jgi:hypothetical protein|nr:hypothetical protein [Streptosporangiaceae bacterium]